MFEDTSALQILIDERQCKLRLQQGSMKSTRDDEFEYCEDMSSGAEEDIAFQQFNKKLRTDTSDK